MSEFESLLPLVFGVAALVPALGALYIDAKRGAKSLVNTNIDKVEKLSDGTLALSPVETNYAVRKLIGFAIEKKPDFIIGINRGGVLVGAYMALSTGLPSNRFLRCCVTFTNNSPEIDCNFKELYGTVLLVDSITRSGRTMKLAVDQLRKDYKKIDQIYTSVIVTSVNEENNFSYSSLDFFVFTTKNHVLQLPWTQSQPNENSTNRSIQIKKEYQQVEEVKLETLASEVYEDLTNASS